MTKETEKQEFIRVLKNRIVNRFNDATHRRKEHAEQWPNDRTTETAFASRIATLEEILTMIEGME